MKRYGKTVLILIAYLISAWFILDPGPFQMALFVFLAQPLTALAVLFYAAEVVGELKQRGIL